MLIEHLKYKNNNKQTLFLSTDFFLFNFFSCNATKCEMWCKRIKFHNFVLIITFFRFIFCFYHGSGSIGEIWTIYWISAKEINDTTFYLPHLCCVQFGWICGNNEQPVRCTLVWMYEFLLVCLFLFLCLCLCMYVCVIAFRV